MSQICQHRFVFFRITSTLFLNGKSPIAHISKLLMRLSVRDCQLQGIWMAESRNPTFSFIVVGRKSSRSCSVKSGPAAFRAAVVVGAAVLEWTSTAQQQQPQQP